MHVSSTKRGAWRDIDFDSSNDPGIEFDDASIGTLVHHCTLYLANGTQYQCPKRRGSEGVEHEKCIIRIEKSRSRRPFNTVGKVLESNIL